MAVAAEVLVLEENDVDLVQRCLVQEVSAAEVVVDLVAVSEASAEVVPVVAAQVVNGNLMKRLLIGASFYVKGGKVLEVNFYTRPGCHLCEDARLMLKLVQEDIPFRINEINIEEDDVLHEKYMLMIPVVELEGSIIQYGRVDYATLLDALWK